MKKWLTGISIFPLLLVFLSACAPFQDNVSNKPLNEYLITHSVELTCMMDSLAQSTEYIELTSGAPEMVGFVTEIGADEYSLPNKAVLIKVPDAAADAAIKNMAGELNLPDDAYEMVVTRMLSSIPSMINAQQGAMTIAATSVLAVNKVFQQHKDLDANIYVILIYDNRSSVTLYRKSVEGITSASSTFLFLTDELVKALTEETVIEYLTGVSEVFDIDGVKVEYITGDTIANYR